LAARLEIGRPTPWHGIGLIRLLLPVFFLVQASFAAVCGAGHDAGSAATQPPLVRLGPAETADAFKKLGELQRGVESVSAHIVQTRRNPLLADEAVSSGRLILKKPDLLRFTISTPEEVTMVVDGTYMWVYRPKKKVAERRRLSNDYAAAQAVKFLSNIMEFSAGEMQKRFAVSVYNDKDGYLFELTPSSGLLARFLSRVTFSFTDGTAVPYSVEVVGSNGATTLTELKDVVINPVPDKDAFVFVPAKGVRVIDLQEDE